MGRRKALDEVWKLLAEMAIDREVQYALADEAQNAELVEEVDCLDELIAQVEEELLHVAKQLREEQNG